MGQDPWEMGRNLERMGLQGLNREALLTYLTTGVRSGEKLIPA
jgi:hypothetical protein